MLLRSLLPLLGSLTSAACAHADGSPLEPAVEAPAHPIASAHPVLAVDEDAVAPETCAEGSGAIACASFTPGQPIHHLAMAVSGGSIGIAWTTDGNGSWVHSAQPGPAHFMVLDERLEPVHRIELGTAARDVTLAPRRSGWAVVVSDGEQVLVQYVDRGGEPEGPSLRIGEWQAPLAVANDRDELLLVHSGVVDGRQATRATLLTSLYGGPMRDQVLMEGTVEPRFGSAALVQDAFLVALRGRDGVEVARVGFDGRVTARHTQVGDSTEYPKLASCGRDARMVWADFSERGQMRWARLDEEGGTDGELVTLGGIPDYFDPSPVTCDGARSFVLLNGYTGGTGVASRLDLVQVDEHGRAGRAVTVRRPGPGPGVYDSRIDRRGDELVVAWLGLQGSIGVARLAPPPAPEAEGGPSLAR
ncbi:MAG: hypothetical protein H6712_04545 [Myxococcales bacterium]|nr:hypothetical protein [Myxococcales bacterium]MCB9713098.1 hypothetical protein [Myxococcales bacterium]